MKILPNNIAVIEGDELFAKWIQQSGRLDHDQFILQQILPYINEGDTVIDVGANIGTHSIAYANKVGEKGSVFAIEPNPKAFECLLYNIGKLPQAYCSALALADTEKKTEYKDNHKNPGAGYLVESEDGEIHTSTLDSMAVSPNFIKIDAEGFEYKILMGARRTIEAAKPVMLIEINHGALARQGDTAKLIYMLLEHMGYTLKPIPDREGILDEPQFDILAIPPKK